MSEPKTEIQRWRAAFPVLLFAMDEDIARLIAAVKAKLDPQPKEKADAQ